MQDELESSSSSCLARRFWTRILDLDVSCSKTHVAGQTSDRPEIGADLVRVCKSTSSFRALNESGSIELERAGILEPEKGHLFSNLLEPIDLVSLYRRNCVFQPRLLPPDR